MDTLNALQFRIPWTGGNPKPEVGGNRAAAEFRIPWTGGNPKRSETKWLRGLQFRIPWTGGNPKLRFPEEFAPTVV